VPEIQGGKTMSVYKRGDKAVFYMNFTVDSVRVTRSTGKFTKKEAKLVEAVEKKRMMVDGALSPREKAARMLLSTAIQRVYDERWKDNKDGLKSQRIAERLMDITGDIPISKIDEEVIKRLIRKLEGSGIKGATINRYLATIKTLLRHHRQPWEHIKLKKESKGRIRVISREEMLTVMELLRGAEQQGKKPYYTEAADLVEVLMDTGCRLSEVLKKFTYTGNINYQINLMTLNETKNGESRSVPMTRRVRGIFEERQYINKVKPFKITVDEAERAWKWVRTMMGLEMDEEFVIHALRHTCASRLVNAGIDLYVVCRWLGHSSIQITERYAHLSPDKLVTAMGALDDRNL
jgi:site-specific recombinase XerD